MSWFRHKSKKVIPQRQRNNIHREIVEMLDCYLNPKKRGFWGVNTRETYARWIIEKIERLQ